MAKTAILNVRIDPETKNNAESLYSSFGITISDAINMFLHQSLLVGGLPFDLKNPRYNAKPRLPCRKPAISSAEKYKRNVILPHTH